MKRNTIPPVARIFLIIGLLLVCLTPIVSRHYPVPDMLKGFTTGLGLALEVIAIIKIQRSKHDRKCSA